MAAAPPLDDAFWRRFRDDHPEVDLVLLPDPALVPPSPAPADDGPRLTPGQVEAVSDRLLDELDEQLAGTPGWPPALPRTRRWRTDVHGRRHLESHLVVEGLAEGEPVPLLRAVGDAFLAAGWRARPLPGDQPRLAARRGPFRATAWVRPDALVVSLRSGDLPSDADGETGR
jgi:hypothetical protein